MANTFLTPSVIAREALSILQETSFLARFVTRDYEADFAGKVGDTVNVRKRAVISPVDYDMGVRNLTIQDVTETAVPVVLDTLLDTSVEITAEQWALELDDFAEQIVEPIMVGYAETLDSKLFALMSDVTQTVGSDASGPAANDATIAVDANKILNDAKVPKMNRYGFVPTSVEAEFLKDAIFHQADQRGDQGGIVEGRIGRKFGVDWFGSALMPAGDDSLVFHPSAFGLVTRTLPVPRGVAPNQAATVNLDGIGIRVVSGYSMDNKADVISFDLLMGVKTLDAVRAVKILA